MRCLEAIARQEVGEDVEVVVVDSGSSDGSAERARRLGARVHEIPPEEFSHGGARNLGAKLAAGDIVVFTSQDAYAADENWLAALVAPLRERARRRRRLRPPAPARERDPFRALFPGLPVRAQATDSAAQRPRPAQLRGDAVLERELGRSSRRPGAVSARSGRDHERGPGVVETGARSRARHRLRASRRRPPLARVHDRRRVPAVLRLRRLGGPRVRERVSDVPARTTAGRRSLRTWRDQMAVENGSPSLAPVRGGLRVCEVRGAAARAPARPHSPSREETAQRTAGSLEPRERPGYPVPRLASPSLPRLRPSLPPDRGRRRAVDARSGPPRRGERSRRHLRDHAPLGRIGTARARRSSHPRAHRSRARVSAGAAHADAAASIRACGRAPSLAPRLRVRHRPHRVVPVLPGAGCERHRQPPEVRARRELARDLDEGRTGAATRDRVVGTIGWLVQQACVVTPHTAYCFSRLHARRSIAAGYAGTPVILPGLYAGPTDPTPATDVDPKLVVYAGRHVQEKRVDQLVRGFALARRDTPGLRLELYGDGPTRPYVEELSRALGLDSSFVLHGRRPEEEVAETIARSACLVTASEREGYGLVVVEAAAHGTPSVVVEGPENAATELVRDGVNGVDRPGRVAREPGASDDASHRRRAGTPRLHRGVVRREREDVDDRRVARARRRGLRTGAHAASASSTMRSSSLRRSCCRRDPPRRPASSAGRRRRSARPARRPGDGLQARPAALFGRRLPPERGSRTRPATPRRRSSSATARGTGPGRRDTRRRRSASARPARLRRGARRSSLSSSTVADLASPPSSTRSGKPKTDRGVRDVGDKTTAYAGDPGPARAHSGDGDPDHDHERRGDVVDDPPILERDLNPPELADDDRRERECNHGREGPIAPHIAVPHDEHDRLAAASARNGQEK